MEAETRSTTLKSVECGANSLLKTAGLHVCEDHPNTYAFCLLTDVD